MRQHVRDNGMVVTWPESDQGKLTQLKANLQSISETNTNIGKHTIEACRRSCLMLVNDVLTKEEILAIPCIWEEAYKKMRSHVQEHGYSFVERKFGRPALSE